jgi:hypothetical protein
VIARNHDHTIVDHYNVSSNGHDSLEIASTSVVEILEDDGVAPSERKYTSKQRIDNEPIAGVEAAGHRVSTNNERPLDESEHDQQKHSY